MEKSTFAYLGEWRRAFRLLLRLAIEEDLGVGDITTQALGVAAERKGQAEVVVKERKAVICGLLAAKILFSGKNRKVIFHCQDGDEVVRGQKILSLTAPIQDLLGYERILLNFLQHLSGIATRTRKWSRALRELGGAPIRLLDTRKTLPGYRVLEKYAVFCGGGENHRMGLFDRYLIKDNHVEIARGAVSALERILDHREHLRSRQTKGKKILIEIECRNLNEVREVLAWNRKQPSTRCADILMLDNFTLPQLRAAFRILREQGDGIQIEVSGNMNIKRLKGLATLERGGIESLSVSVGGLTHSISAVDLSMYITRV